MLLLVGNIGPSLIDPYEKQVLKVYNDDVILALSNRSTSTLMNTAINFL